MKVTRYLALALVLIAVLAAVGWYLRNSIIERLSGPLLAQYGLTITGVSLDALATDSASISYLVLEHESGTTIAIDDLRLPIRAPSTGMRPFSAAKVRIVPAAGDGQPLALAALTEQLLALPDVVPGTVIGVAELEVSPYPAVRDLRWSAGEARQELSASLGAVNFLLRVASQGDGRYEAALSMQLASVNRPAQVVEAMVQRTGAGFLLTGSAAIDLPATGMTVSAIAESLGADPAGIEFASGTAAIEISAEVTGDANGGARLEVLVAPSAPIEFAYSVESGNVNTVSVRSAGPIRISATYPEIRWAISEEQLILSLTYKDWLDVSATASKLECGNGPACSMAVKLVADNVDLDTARAARLEFAGAHDLRMADGGFNLSVRPNARLSLAGLSFAETEAAGVTARLQSGATLSLTDSGWQLSAAAIDAELDSLALDEAMSFSAPLTIRDLAVDYADQATSVTALLNSASSQLSWQKLLITLPGFRGDFSLRDDTFATRLSTVGLQREATIIAEHNPGEGTGRLSVSDGALSFAAGKLSGRVSPWSHQWDVSAGTVSWDLQLGWQLSDAGPAISGTTWMQLDRLAGSYGDTAIAGLSTRLAASLPATTGFNVDPGRIEIALLDVGIPVENISADYVLHPAGLAADVTNLRMQAFGGVVTADPFTYRVGAETNSLLLRADSLELVELLTLEEFEAVQLTGRIGAELPVVIEGTTVSIYDGKLTGEAPGGVIRYRPDAVPSGDATTGMGLVTRTLSNFEYDTLESSVAYDKDGDLVLKMRLNGRNPDIQGGRTVVLNLSIENNVPQMLRSLQATRAVEEILDKRVRK